MGVVLPCEIQRLREGEREEEGSLGQETSVSGSKNATARASVP
jgi:hypothetical protein